MATNTLKTRIKLKYDTFTNWTAINPVLLKGEIAVVSIASGNTQEVNSITAPQILFKVGDGISTFSTLPFTSGLAADVYNWAKKSTLDFSDLSAAFLASLDSRISGKVQDTNTHYRLTSAGLNKYKLQKKDLDESTWTDVGDSSVTIDFSAIENMQDKITASGILKGDGTSVSAATAGIDYVADISTSGTGNYISGITYTNGTATFSKSTAGTAIAADVATNGVSENNTKLPTAAQVKSYVDSAIAGISQFKYEVVASLPTATAATMGKIYLVPLTASSTQNIYSEYITLDKGSGSPRYIWEKLGDTSIDLSAYIKSVNGKTPDGNGAVTITSDDISEGTNHKFVSTTEKSSWNSKQDAITSNNKLSASLVADDATHRFVTDTEKNTWNSKQNPLSAGTNIDITNNTVSVSYGTATIDTATGFTITTSDALSSVDCVAETNIYSSIYISAAANFQEMLLHNVTLDTTSDSWLSMELGTEYPSITYSGVKYTGNDKVCILITRTGDSSVDVHVFPPEALFIYDGYTKLNAQKLSQEDSDYLIIDGGTAVTVI